MYIGCSGKHGHGMQNLANAVDTRLIQNDIRNTTKEGVANGLFAEMGNSAVKMGERTTREITKKSQRRGNKWQELVRPR